MHSIEFVILFACSFRGYRFGCGTKCLASSSSRVSRRNNDASLILLGKYMYYIRQKS